MTASQNENPTAPRSQNQEAPTHGLWSPAPRQPAAASPAPCSGPQLWTPTRGRQEAVSEAPPTLKDQLAEAMSDSMFAVKTDRNEGQDVVRSQEILDAYAARQRPLETGLPAVTTPTWDLDDLDEEYFAVPLKRGRCRCGFEIPESQSKTKTLSKKSSS
ncbi:hypothetical protein BP5796_00616 [Coleophoma crateriformis]|uniref:Uncharacterized protein n=1 Tax=Coleophoma crateriformis TaxID=565419 RepID=A0A3D8T8F7_9HELO|nr:hypothetical protein BP5796_00616 [Coleophoma crateriformis]